VHRYKSSALLVYRELQTCVNRRDAMKDKRVASYSQMLLLNTDFESRNFPVDRDHHLVTTSLFKI
jgi:hypothetical protein